MLRTSLATLLLLVLPSIAQAAPQWVESFNASYISLGISALASDLAYEDDPQAAREAIAVYEADLNMDGQPEILAMNENPGSCGSAGCHIILLTRVNGSFVIIWNDWNMPDGLTITDRVSNGFRAIDGGASRNEDGEEEERLWVFNGNEYRLGNLSDTEGTWEVGEPAPSPSPRASLTTGRYWVSVRDVAIAPTKQSGSPWDQSGEADPYVGIRVEGSSPNAFEFACRADDTLFIACDLSQNPFDVTPSTKLSIRVLDEDAMFNDMIGTSARPISPMTDCPKSGVCTIPTTQQLQSFSLEFHRIQ